MISQLDDVVCQWTESDPGQILLRLGIFDVHSARFSHLLLRSADPQIILNTGKIATA